MKLAIPCDENKEWNSTVGYHFGRVPFFAIWDEESDHLEMIDNKSSHRGGTKLPADFLAEKCNGIICKGIGSRAISLCNNLGVKVYLGAGDTVESTIDLFKRGELREATLDEGCKH